MIFRLGYRRRVWWPLRHRGEDGSYYMLWPIRVKLAPRGMRGSLSCHGWQVGYIKNPWTTEHSDDCIPGSFSLYGQTVTIGPLQISFGGEVKR